MMISFSTYYILFFVLCVSLLAVVRPIQALVPAPRTSTFTSTTAMRYQSEGVVQVGETTTTRLHTQLPMGTKVVRPSKISNIIVDELSSLDEIKYFLLEDERPVVIKFYAKWCKKCQQVGRQFDRLALEMGDRIVDQQFVDGDVRFAQVECTPQSQAFITKELQIQGVPTLQMYVGIHKLLDGDSSIKNIRKELTQIEDLSHRDICQRAVDADDGILSSLIEESFFDSPDFLNEEW